MDTNLDIMKKMIKEYSFEKRGHLGLLFKELADDSVSWRADAAVHIFELEVCIAENARLYMGHKTLKMCRSA